MHWGGVPFCAHRAVLSPELSSLPEAASKWPSVFSFYYCILILHSPYCYLFFILSWLVGLLSVSLHQSTSSTGPVTVSGHPFERCLRPSRPSVSSGARGDSHMPSRVWVRAVVQLFSLWPICSSFHPSLVVCRLAGSALMLWPSRQSGVSVPLPAPPSAGPARSVCPIVARDIPGGP